MKQYKGTGVSSGSAIGRVHIIKRFADVPEKRTGNGAEAEYMRFEEARAEVAEQLLALSKKVREEIGEKEAEIFTAHSRIAQDRTLARETKSMLELENASAEWALHAAAEKLFMRLAAAGDSLIRARADDIRDVSGRITRRLMGIPDADAQIPPGSVVIADELLPGDTATLPKDCVVGFVTEKGGFTSHVSIMARALEIPAVVGIPGIHELARPGEELALDGATGEVVISPDKLAVERFRQQMEDYKAQKELVSVYKDRATETMDGRRILVEANIGGLSDLDAAIANGCEGVGLFRTEFLFMEKPRIPTEDEQYEIYSKAARRLEGRPLVIRTLDIGGDKPVSHLNIEKEENPFLGLRAIRYSLANQTLFVRQIRAILRAGSVGNIQMMLPMITALPELLQAKDVVDEAARQLDDEGVSYSRVPVGIMIETPASAVMAGVFAEHCDFFSIGTNDLIQYTMAVDRGNSKVAYLYNMCEPAVLNLILHVIKSAHAAGISVSMCGEAAGHLPLVPVLAAMNLDAFSVCPSLVPAVRKAICETHSDKSEAILSRVRSFRSAAEAEETLTAGL